MGHPLRLVRGCVSVLTHAEPKCEFPSSDAHGSSHPTLPFSTRSQDGQHTDLCRLQSTPSSNPDRTTYHSTASFPLKLTPSGSHADLRAQLNVAKQQGCIGLLLEIVDTQYNGRVIDPVLLQRARRACAEVNLLFAVDESLTAIRCGAPFSFQREEYAGIDPPDVVFFGRALAAQGSAVKFDAPLVRSLGITDQRMRAAAVRGWQQRRPSQNARPVPPAVLIQAIAAADLAEGRDFPMLSRAVGQTVRGLVMKHVRKKEACLGDSRPALQQHEVLGGLGSLIFVHKDVAAGMKIMGASTSESWMPWVRWFPRLEIEMAQPEALEAIVGQSSLQNRQGLTRTLLQQGLRPNWCFSCGNRATNTAQAWCQTCCINTCEDETCLALLRGHECVSEQE